MWILKKHTNIKITVAKICTLNLVIHYQSFAIQIILYCNATHIFHCKNSFLEQLQSLIWLLFVTHIDRQSRSLLISFKLYITFITLYLLHLPHILKPTLFHKDLVRFLAITPSMTVSKNRSSYDCMQQII